MSKPLLTLPQLIQRGAERSLERIEYIQVLQMRRARQIAGQQKTTPPSGQVMMSEELGAIQESLVASFGVMARAKPPSTGDAPADMEQVMSELMKGQVKK
jgi:hypothetical protein